MNAYSYWEQGRDLGSGQIVSMTPFSPSNGGAVLGTVPLGGAGMALSAVAQFGIYCEMRRMNHLKEAEFEERRHGWINDIASQWIEEHKHISGIRRDVTLAVSRECQKMWEKLCMNEMIDVPQSVLLQISRMTEFLEWNYFLAASASNNLVEASGSSEKWILNSSLKSKAIVDETLEEALNESKGEWWKGLLKTLGGIPLLLVPGVGPFAGGGAIGYGVAEMFKCFSVKKSDLEDLDDKISLLQFGAAAIMLESASKQVSFLLEKQDFKKPMRFAAMEENNKMVDFLLEPVTSGGFFRKEKVSLKPVAIPR